MFASVEFVKVECQSCAATGCPESYFAQAANFAYHVGGLLIGYDVDVVVAFVGGTQAAFGSQFGFQQFATDGLYDFFHKPVLEILFHRCRARLGFRRVLQFVYFILNVGSPLGGCLGLVESFPGNGAAYFNGKGFVAVAEHFVHEEKHGDVELYAQYFAEVGQPVKPGGVVSAEVYGNDVALCFDTFGNECLGPWQVAYHALLFARAQSGRKHDDVVVAAETGFDHGREAAALCAHLVDGDAEGASP